MLLLLPLLPPKNLRLKPEGACFDGEMRVDIAATVVGIDPDEVGVKVAPFDDEFTKVRRPWKFGGGSISC